MLCSDCLKIPQALEPYATGSYDSGELNDLIGIAQELAEGPGPYAALLSASLAAREAQPPALNSQFLVPRDLNVILKQTVAALEESARSGCEGCVFWLSWLPQRALDHPDTSITAKAIPKSYGDTYTGRITSAIGLEFLDQKLKSHNLDGFPSDALKDTEADAPIFDICTAEDNPAIEDERILGRTLASGSAQSSLVNLQTWLQRCSSSHDCTNVQQPYAPTRLLEIRPQQPGAEPQVRLIITEEQFRAPYVALSYCWGTTTDLFKTTTTNIEMFKKSIEFELMPVVFREALMVAQALDVQYVWIDALCIIQDSTDDWAAEASKMGTVYQNSFLTVVASSSSGVHESFLHSRQAQPSLKMPFKSQNMNDSGEILIRRADRKLGSRFSSRKHWQQQVHKRAWTLQERFLSTRTVFFDPDQMLFECSEQRRFESFNTIVNLEGRDYPDQLATGRRGNDNFANNLSKSRLGSAWSKETIYDPHPLLYADKYAQVEFNEHWHRVLIDFGLRNLTYTSDTLFALSAIARKFGADTGDVYMAGLWMGDLRKGLLWNMRWYPSETKHRVSPRLEPVLTGFSEHQRITASSGPSWSWARRFTDPDKINFSVVASQKPLHDEYDVQPVSYFALPLFNEDEFGPVSIGMLKLQGYMTRLDLVFGYKSPDTMGFDSHEGVLLLTETIILPEGSTGHIKCCVDSLPELIPKGPAPTAEFQYDPVRLEALIVAGFSTNTVQKSYSHGKRAMYYGLLLRATSYVSASGEFVYERVGIFSMDPEIGEETFEDFIGVEVHAATPETWKGWNVREIDIV